MKAVLILTALLVLVGVAINARYLRSSAEVEATATAIAPIAIPPVLGQSDEAGSEVKLVLLALMREGFDSSEMQLDPGEYLLIIGNRTGLKEVRVRLEREGNGRVAEATLGGRQRDWKQRLRLTAGTHVVTANDNPDWTCRITVRP
jgi:hypothetical protein